MAAFARGTKAWADSCSRCHTMRDPKELSDRSWESSVPTCVYVPASTTSRYVTSPFFSKGVTDMTRFSLFIASLVLLGSTQTTALAADGKGLYEATCIACHGAKAQGAIPGVPDLAKGGRLTKPDAELAANIVNGFQSKGSPMAMPPKGGNPDLTAADVQALVTYMRALTGASPARPVNVAPKRVPAPAAAVPAPAVAPAPATPLAPLAAAAATTAGAPYPQPADTPALQPDMAAFARGAKAWANNCARCHGMRDPKEQTDRQWKIVMTHMRLRAGLDGQQVRDITLFLQGSN